MSGQQYEGLLLGKAGRDRRDDGSFGSGGMMRLRIGNSSQSEELAEKSDHVHYRIPRDILVFRPHKAEQFLWVVGHLIAG